MANKTLRALTLSAASADANGSDLENLGSKAAHVTIDITAISGTGATGTFTVQGKDAVSGKYYTILASAGLTATGTTVLKIGPGLTAAANTVANDIVPQFFRVIVAITGTTPSVTATVGVALVG